MSAEIVSEGIVYLVGAGPGDPELITRRGYAYLQQANVVVFDRLIPPALLCDAPLAAERYCVAKSPGRHRLSQREIERLLVAKAREGKVVVRLKGGDPFLFGRGGEEVHALKQAGVRVEVVPGVSSALAVPAAVGIPVTHRGISDGVAVWTGHRSDSRRCHELDAPTQVVLMGVESLSDTVAGLIDAGRSPQTPVAVISWGTTARQRWVIATLESIVRRVELAGLTAPATVVVGEVVALAQAGEEREEDGSLAGKRVAYVCAVRPGAEAHSLARRLAAQGVDCRGAEVFALPIGTIARVGAAPLPEPEMVGLLDDLIREGMIDVILLESLQCLETIVSVQPDHALSVGLPRCIDVRLVPETRAAEVRGVVAEFR